MTVGFIMLCHTAFDRAAQVARHWARQGSPVVIHVDARVKAGALRRFRRDLAAEANIRFAPQFACDWGGWGLVAATLAASELMLREFPGVQHVCLASGSCLPLRPVADLQSWLLARPGVDFIESVTTEDVGWTVGGLDIERFTLRFPFSWRRHRALFDGYVRLQRRLGFRRRIPAGLVPHLGSQWWCLTRATLEAIVTHPRRAEFDRYFRRVWIPDESYFQTLVRLVAPRIESRSLTLHKFDFQGKPHVFYDDHLQLLRKSDCFLARKIWPQADRLYAAFLAQPLVAPGATDPNPGKIDRLFARATERRTKGRPGLYMQSRFPNPNWENGLTAAPYSVFQGFAPLFDGFDIWLGKAIGVRVHGHLFAPDRVCFAGDETTFNGALSDSAALRDHNPRGFLTNLIWNTRGERQCFQFGPDDRQEILPFLLRDARAQISVITGAWALPLFQARQPVAEIRKEAARLQKAEMIQLDLMRRADTKARLRIWSLADFVEDPEGPIQEILDEMAPRAGRRLTESPRLIDLSGFGGFLQDLRNQGMQPVLTGDFPVIDGPRPPPSRRSRPHLVK